MQQQYTVLLFLFALLFYTTSLVSCQDRTVFAQFDQGIPITNVNETVRYQFIITPGRDFLFVDVLPGAAPDFNLTVNLLNTENPFSGSTYQQTDYNAVMYFQITQTPKSRWNTAITYKYLNLNTKLDASTLTMGLLDINTLKYKPFTAGECVNDVETKQVTQPTNSLLDMTASINTIGIFARQLQKPQSSSNIPNPPPVSSTSVITPVSVSLLLLLGYILF